MSIYGTNASLQTFTSFTGDSFIDVCLLKPMLLVNHPPLQFADITDPLLSTAALSSDSTVTGFRPKAVKVASYLAR